LKPEHFTQLLALDYIIAIIPLFSATNTTIQGIDLICELNLAMAMLTKQNIQQLSL
jgi:hypothetical protein